MPKRPPKSGYARIAQSDEEEGHDDADDNSRYSNESDDDPFRDNNRQHTLSRPFALNTHSQPKSWQVSMHMPDGGSEHHSLRRPQRLRAHSGVDIKAINARLERWAEEIKERFTRRRGGKGKSTDDDEEQLEIHHSVFQAPEGVRPATRDTLAPSADDIAGRMSKLEFDDLIESVRTAIELGTHPKLISQGSSGSYFARNAGGRTVGVFKPKDEEPYANKNPKWTKWLHRNLLPFAFGRAMLIPNLSYVSEAAAYVLDCQLRTDIVPYTDVVHLSSKSFHYDWMERRAYYRKGRAFPEKPGSFQVFLKGFKGATDFFQEHPWPDQLPGAAGASAAPGRSSSTRRRQNGWTESCRPTGPVEEQDEYDEEEEDNEDTSNHPRRESQARRREFWTEDLQQRFREELEKLVILDYIMRNTDRGTDNWMIRVDQEEKQQQQQQQQQQRDGDAGNSWDPAAAAAAAAQGYDRRTESMTTTKQQPTTTQHRTPWPATAPITTTAVPKIGAIDNSLSWPWKHPDAWRSYPFGWLFLPVSLIGRPFSAKTRAHFLPLLTSNHWWQETTTRLRACFMLDADFEEKMFARQMAVMKGQAWNVLETLKCADHGPLELTRRARVLVWDDVVEIPVAGPLAQATGGGAAAAALAEQQVRGSSGGSRTTAASQVAAALERSSPSTTSRVRGSKALEEEEEEMDISAALAPPPPPQKDQQQPLDAVLPTIPEQRPLDRSSNGGGGGGIRPGAFRSRTSIGRTSNDLPRRGAPWATPPSERRRRFSLALGLSTHDGLLDEEGDLGYAAAAHLHENSMRRVIVERLEVVRSKQPFFSWC